MALTITHTTVATAADDPSAEINKAEWNEAHTLAGDYLRKATVTLSSADILDLHNTPITLVAAPGAGKFLVPYHIVSAVHDGSAPYTVDTPPTIYYADDSSNSLGSLTGLDGSADRVLMLGGNNTPSVDHAVSAVENKAIVARNDNPALTDGDRSLTVSVWYSVEDVP